MTVFIRYNLEICSGPPYEFAPRTKELTVTKVDPLHAMTDLYGTLPGLPLYSTTSDLQMNTIQSNMTPMGMGPAPAPVQFKNAMRMGVGIVFDQVHFCLVLSTMKRMRQCSLAAVRAVFAASLWPLKQA